MKTVHLPRTTDLNGFAHGPSTPSGSWWGRGFQAAIVLMLLLAVGTQAIITAPAMRDAAAAVRQSNESMHQHEADEVDRLRLVNEARKSEIVNNAAVIVQQERMLKQLKEMNERLAKQRDE